MRPLLVGFSECHELFGNGEHGKIAAELAVNAVKQGRKTGVSLVFDTQSSRADAISSQPRWLQRVLQRQDVALQ
jgi:S-DNA-T family DNA segregation ATPase FtsK/SpoIIIE